MEVTIRNSVAKSDREYLPEILEKALSFVKQKYPNVDFDKVDVIFSGTVRRGKYFRNDENSKYTRPCIQVPTNREGEYLYWKPSLGMVRKTVEDVGRYDTTCSCIIHELTHHAQYEENRSKGELETTMNQLEYHKTFRPDVYELFMNE